MPQPTLFGSQIRANLISGFSATGSQFYPSITALANGKLALAWNTANGHEIGIFRASGTEANVSTGILFALPNGTLTASEGQIDIAALSDGRIVAAWSNNTVTAADSGQVQWAYLSETEGQGTINTLLQAGAQTDTVVAAGLNSRFVIVGRDAANAGDAQRVVSVNGLGTTLFTAGDLGSGSFTAGTQQQPNIATLANGSYITAWTDLHDGTIKGAILLEDGSRVSAFTLATGTPQNLSVQDDTLGLTALANGGFALSFASGNEIKYRLFDASGTATTALLSTSGFNASFGQAAIGTLDGRLMLVSATTGGSQLRGQMVRADGTLDGASFLIADNGGNFQPALALLADGRVAVSYSANGLTGGNGRDIAFQIVDPRETGVDLIGTAGADEFYGSAFGDVILTGQGNDTIHGGAGNDRLTGGTGNDTFVYTARNFDNDTITDFTAGDRIDLAALNVADLAMLRPFMTQSGANTVISLFFGGVSETITLNNVTASSLTASSFIFNTSTVALTVLGTGGNDVLFGRNGNDFISAGNGNDTISSGAGSDTITGGAGDDTIIGGAGSDTIDGGAGFDVALYNSIRRAEAPDTRTGIEEARFVDGTITTVASSVSAQVMRLYSATLNRAPDQAGLEFGVASAGQIGLAGVANLLVSSSEFQTQFGALSNQQFVEQLYVFALGRTGDAGGVAGWVNALNSGTSRGQVVLGFSESAEHQVRTAATLAAGLWVPDAQAQVIARLYDATFDRLPDPDGLSGWVNALKSGTPLLTIAAAFAGSSEFQAAYGALSNQAFVEQLYLFCLNRAGDTGGIGYWTAQLNGGLSRAAVLLEFSESAEHAALTAPSWLGGIRFLGDMGPSPLEGATDGDTGADGLGFDGFGIDGLDGFLLPATDAGIDNAIDVTAATALEMLTAANEALLALGRADLVIGSPGDNPPLDFVLPVTTEGSALQTGSSITDPLDLALGSPDAIGGDSTTAAGDDLLLGLLRPSRDAFSDSVGGPDVPLPLTVTLTADPIHGWLGQGSDYTIV